MRGTRKHARPCLCLFCLLYYTVFTQTTQGWERQTAVRTGWRQCTLGEALTLQRGFDLPERQRRPGTVPVVSSSGVTGWHDTAKVRAPGVVTGRYGTLGDVFYVKEDFWPLNTALYVRDFKGNHPRFIHYLLHYYLGMLNLSQHNAASVLPGVNRNALHRLVVSLPPLPIQRTVAGILAAYDDLIENHTRRIANLEERARLLYDEWFVKFRFPGHERVRLVESAVGMVPEGWEVVKLGEIAQELRRTVHPASVDPETPYVGLEHLPRRSIALTEWGTARSVQSTKLWFEKGEILFGKIRPNLHKVCVAPFRGICSSDTIVIVSKQKEYQSLILYYVSGEDFVAFASRTAQGTNMPRASWEVLATRPLALPPQPVLAPFNEFVKSAVEEIANGLLRNAILRQTRDRLLPGLVAGEIDVAGWSAGEAREMASVLARGAGSLRRVAEAAGPVEPVGDEGMGWDSLWE